MNSYGHFCRPAMVPLLEALGLDATYVMAEGDYLFSQSAGLQWLAARPRLKPAAAIHRTR